MAHNSYYTAYPRMHMGVGRVNEKQIKAFYVFPYLH